jgi:hypothetical protein
MLWICGIIITHSNSSMHLFIMAIIRGGYWAGCRRTRHAGHESAVSSACWTALRPAWCALAAMLSRNVWHVRKHVPPTTTRTCLFCSLNLCTILDSAYVQPADRQTVQQTGSQTDKPERKTDIQIDRQMHPEERTDRPSEHGVLHILWMNSEGYCHVTLSVHYIVLTA